MSHKAIWHAALLTLAMGLAGYATAEDAMGDKPADDAPKQETSKDGAAKEQSDRPGAEGRRDRGTPEGRARMQERMRERLFEGITLTDEQKAKVDEIFNQAHAEREAWFEKNGESVRKLREEIRAARESDNQEALNKARAEFRTLMQDAPRPMAAFNAVRETLTDEQKAAFDKNSEAMREQWQRRGRGGQGQDGGNNERQRRREGDGNVQKDAKQLDI